MFEDLGQEIQSKVDRYLYKESIERGSREANKHCENLSVGLESQIKECCYLG